MGLSDSIVERSPEGIVVVSEDGEILGYNERFRDFWKVPESAMDSGDADEVTEAMSEKASVEDIRCLEGRTETETVERVELEDGTVFSQHSVPLEAEEGSHGRIWFYQDITETVERERDLRSRIERADRFASLASHDLQTPLSIIGGNLRLAEEKGDPRHFEVCREMLERMSRTIEDTLSLARNSDEEMDLNSVALSEAAEECWQDLQTENASLCTETGVSVTAHKGMLHILLRNLLKNSVEHGGEGVTVTVSHLEDGNGFRVEDDGPGIPEAVRGNVLEPGSTTSRSGHGLGLYMIGEVVEAHGWSLSLSESEEGGAAFDIEDVEVYADA
jgi:signal transduction histidine kinase